MVIDEVLIIIIGLIMWNSTKPVLQTRVAHTHIDDKCVKQYTSERTTLGIVFPQHYHHYTLMK